MPSSKKLKICKVESKSFAKYCLMRGVDYLGVHDIPADFNAAKQALCGYIAAHGGKALLLTKTTDIAQLQKLADFYKPWAIQLHHPVTVAELHNLCAELSVPIIPVFTDETDLETVRSLIRASQFALYDRSFVGGTGTRNAATHVRHLSLDLLQKVLFAGGVTPETLADIPDAVGGYDVQSYCRANKAPHYGRAEKLIHAVKGAPTRQLSVSLTDLPADAPMPEYHSSPSLEYQVDYSEGALYSAFSVDTQKISDTIARVDAPFTLHIFEASERGFQRVIDDFMAQFAPKIVRVNIQYSPGLAIEEIDTGDAKKCVSLYYRDLEMYMQHYPVPHQCVSLILPSDMKEKTAFLAQNEAVIKRFTQTEVWFDRKVDHATVTEVLRYDANANFIAGQYVLTDWSHETELTQSLEHHA